MSHQVRLNLKTASCVAVGAFNMYVIQPVYLAEMGILEEGANVKLEADVRHPGFRFTIASSGLTWEVRPDRLSIEGRSLDDDCGAPLSELLRHLNWTPVRAVGLNAVFVGDADAAGHSLDAIFQNSITTQEYEVSQQTWHRAFKDSQGVITNLQLSLSAGKLTLAINVHTELSKLPRQTEMTKAARKACDGFRVDLDRAIKLASRVLPVELSHDNVHV